MIFNHEIACQIGHYIVQQTILRPDIDPKEIPSLAELEQKDQSIIA